MKFHELPLAGAYTIDLDLIEDDRGFNARAWCRNEFTAAGLPTDLAQINVIHNRVRGTVRGFHYQWPPHGEAKLFRVTSGAIHDVIVDLRPESATFGQHVSVTLRAEDHRMLFVPARFGQAFQTLEDDTQLTYQVTEFYTPDAGDGFRWDDPAFGIDWPLEPVSISAKDASWPDLDLDLVARRMRGD